MDAQDNSLNDVQSTMSVPRDSKHLGELKDYGILLRLGGEYLCEQPVLEKLGSDLEKTAESLKEYVERLRGKFVGKPVEEINFSQPLEGIFNIAQGLKSPDTQVEEKCKAGDLGVELMEKRSILINSINEFIDKIEGRSVTYKPTDSLYQHFERLKFLFLRLVSTYKILSRVIAFVGVACFFLLVVLLATMETERELMVKVNESQMQIKEKQAALQKLEEKMRQIQDRIRMMEASDQWELTREEKIRLMELNLAAHKLSEKKEKLEFEIEMENKNLEKKRKEIVELKNKSIFERIFRL